MVIDQNTLTVYAALAEIVYRRAGVDQALIFNDIAKVIGPNAVIDAVNPAVNTVYVKSQDDDPDVVVTDQNSQAASLGPLKTDDVYYYSDRGFSGMIVEIGGKHVVVFRGTDTTLSGWSSVFASALGGVYERDEYVFIKNWWGG